MNETSKNERAKKIMGLRLEGMPEGAIFIDFPCELGYVCPVCGANYERLNWSEYNAFLWCEVCDKDYPSAFCQPDIDKAIETFLASVSDVVALDNERLRKALVGLREFIMPQVNKAKHDKAPGRTEFWCGLRNRIDTALRP